MKIGRSHTLSSQPRGGARHSGIDSSGQQGAAGRSRQHDGAPTRDLLGERGVDKALGHDDPTTLTQSLYTTRFRPLRSWRLGRYIGSFKNQHEHPGGPGARLVRRCFQFSLPVRSVSRFWTTGRFYGLRLFRFCARRPHTYKYTADAPTYIPHTHLTRGTRASPQPHGPRTQMLEQENSLQMSNSRSSPREERAIADTP